MLQELPDYLALGVDVTDYQALVRELRIERQRLNMSCEQLDDRAGLPDRYMNKLENWRSSSGRCLGDTSLPLVLGALGLKLVLMRDEQPRLKRRAA